MGQKVNPVGLRLGIVRGWESSWYGGREFADNLIEDEPVSYTHLDVYKRQV